MRRIKCLRRLSLLLLLLLLHSVLYSQATSTVQSNLTSIEDYAINIENNSLQQKQLIESLQIDLAESQKLLDDYMKRQNEMSQMQEALLKQLKCYEARYKSWKTVAMVAIPLTAITATGITYMVLSNK